MPQAEIESLKLFHFSLHLANIKFNSNKIQKIQYYIFKHPDEGLMFKN